MATPNTFGKKAAPAAAAQKQNAFAAKKPAAPAASANVFLNPTQNQYGDTCYEGEINGYAAVMSPTKDPEKFKLNYAAADGSAQFSVGTMKEGKWGPYASFIVNGEWWYATPKENKRGPYVMLKNSGKAVEPREHSVAGEADNDAPSAPEAIDVDANGHRIDEGDVEIPAEAYAPAKKAFGAKPAPVAKPAPAAKPASAGKPARFNAKKAGLDDIPF